jgi:hypothetical protein
VGVFERIHRRQPYLMMAYCAGKPSRQPIFLPSSYVRQ